MSAPTVEFVGPDLRIRFDRFDLDSYKLFLRVKTIPEYRLTFNESDETYTVSAPARFAELLGVERPARASESLPLSEYLYDDQRYIVRTALDARRYAVWSDCGLGKTSIGLEWARHVIHESSGRVLVVTLNEIVPQWIEEARRFYGDSLPIARLNSRAEMQRWCASGPGQLAVTNYEKFNHKTDADQVVNELRQLAGIILDESSRLKTGGGKQKWAIIKSSKGIPCKLSLTATPAPNEIMEFASQASFLEKMRSDNEILWTYFSRDQKTQEWTIKPHARAAFFEFMSSWSIYVREPKRYGWRLTLPDVPPPEYIRVNIDPTPEQETAAAKIMDATAGGEQPLFAARLPNAIERLKLSQIAKGFIYQGNLARAGEKATRKVKRIPSNKPDIVTQIVDDEVMSGAQVLVWTVFDGESSLLARKLTAAKVEFDLLTGSTVESRRLDILDRFRRGECRVLVSRAALLGFGMNFQCCSAMVFSGWTDSYESFYQAVRRAVRHGQTERVRVYLPCVCGLEDDTLDNLDKKANRMESAVSEMEASYLKVMGRDVA